MAKGKQLFNAHINQKVAEKLRGAAKREGMTYSGWLEKAIMRQVKEVEEATGKRIKGIAPRPIKRRNAA
jgi:hypothetical protein